MAIGQEVLLAYKGTFSWLSPRLYLAMKFLAPLVFMAYFSYLAGFFIGPQGLRYAALGNAVLMIGVNAVMGITISVGSERWHGNFAALLVTPASRFYIFYGRAIMHIIDGMFSIVVGLIFAAFLFGVDFGNANFLSLAVVIALTAFSVAGYGFLLGGYALLVRQVGAIFNAAFFSLMLLCGANFPVSSLPLWLQPVSYAIPLTYGIEASRMAVEGADLFEISPVLALEVGTGVTMLIIGYLVFRYIEILVRKKGTFDYG